MKKEIIIISIFCLLLCGCENTDIVEQKSTSDIEETRITSSSIIPTPTDDNQISSLSKEVDKDTEIINYFSSAKNKISSYTVSNARSSVKDLFITIVDFIFYDGEIKGVKFSELKDSTKAKIILYAIDIDNIIEAKWPGWKDTIKSTTSNVYNGITLKLKSLGITYENKLRDTIGANAYDTTKETINDQTSGAGDVINGIISEAKDLGSSAVNSIKNWYNILKKN